MLPEDPHFFADSTATVLSVGGFVIGLIFGAIVIATNFCTMAAIADIVACGDYRRFRSWILAIAVALAGSQALQAMGVLQLEDSIYLRGGVNWLGSIGGGLMFGFGMVLSGGCPSRNLARAGTGDLRAAMTLLVTGLFAYTTMGGLLAPARRYLERHTVLPVPAGASSSLADLASFFTGLHSVWTGRVALAAALTAAALLYCFASPVFRISARHILGGATIGACAVAGWALTTLAQDDFALMPMAPISLSFVRPIADSIDYITRFTGVNGMGFSVALVLGSAVGAMAAALLTGRFRLQGFAGATDTARNLTGAMMMGIGGVFALGCSIGQGIAGISTMATGSFLALGAMALGAVGGVKYLEKRV